MNAIVLSVVLQVVGVGGDAPATYEQAYREAQANGRPLVVLVGADWCPHCQTMKRGVLARMVQSGKLSRVNYAVVDADRERELAGRLMHGGSIPQLIVFSKKNAGAWSREQITGATGEDAVAAMIDRAAKTADVASADGAKETR